PLGERGPRGAAPGPPPGGSATPPGGLFTAVHRPEGPDSSGTAPIGNRFPIRPPFGRPFPKESRRIPLIPFPTRPSGKTRAPLPRHSPGGGPAHPNPMGRSFPSTLPAAFRRTEQGDSENFPALLSHPGTGLPAPSIGIRYPIVPPTLFGRAPTEKPDRAPRFRPADPRPAGRNRITRLRPTRSRRSRRSAGGHRPPARSRPRRRRAARRGTGNRVRNPCPSSTRRAPVQKRRPPRLYPPPARRPPAP